MADDIETTKREAERWWTFRETSIAYAKDYGISTIRSLVLINGAAVIAALTFISHLSRDSMASADFQTVNFSIAAAVSVAMSFVLFAVGSFLALSGLSMK